MKKVRQESLHLIELADNEIQRFGETFVQDDRLEFLNFADESVAAVRETLVTCDV
jgi:hypothetical protein